MSLHCILKSMGCTFLITALRYYYSVKIIVQNKAMVLIFVTFLKISYIEFLPYSRIFPLIVFIYLSDAYFKDSSNFTSLADTLFFFNLILIF